MGVLYNSLQTEAAVREQNDAYVDEGGEGARILIRRLWIGPPPTANVEAQMARYRDAATKHTATAGIVDRWAADDGLIAAPDGSEAAERLFETMVDRAVTHSTSESSWPVSLQSRCTTRSPATGPRRYLGCVNSSDGDHWRVVSDIKVTTFDITYIHC